MRNAGQLPAHAQLLRNTLLRWMLLPLLLMLMPRSACALRGSQGLASAPTQRAFDAPLVTGAGRSGSHAIARWLTSVGVPAWHEGAGEGAVSVSWYYAATLQNASAWAELVKHPLINHCTREHPPKPCNAMVSFSKVVHVVRDPLESISSLASCFCASGNLSLVHGRSWDSMAFKFAEKYVGWLGLSRVERAATYWLKWNRLVSSKAAVTFRIEGLNGKALLEAIGKHGEAGKDLPPILQEEGSPRRQRGRALTWSELRKQVGPKLAMEVFQQAMAYGYAYDRQQRLTAD